MLQLLVAACLAAGDGGAGDDLATDPYETAAEEAPADAGAVAAPIEVADAGVVEPLASDKPVETPLPPPTVEAEKRDSRPEFVKGELSVYLGSDRLTVNSTYQYLQFQ